MYTNIFFMNRKNLIGILVSGIFFFSCCTSNKPVKTATEKEKHPVKKNIFEIIAPSQQETVYFGESIALQLKGKKKTVPDSLSANLDNNNVGLTKTGDLDYTLFPRAETAGRKNIILTVYYNDSLRERLNLKIMLLPKEAPKDISYKVIRSFYHDPEAYIQGLLFYKGYLYESTGQPNRSSIRKTNPQNGEVLRKKDLEPQYFGEGLSLVGNELYMLTYHARKVFVFDLETFEPKRNYNLQTEEGWGLTYNGKDLILSDGSAYIYYFEPEYFSLDRQIEICDNKGLVHSLNEIEITPYGLFANIYTKNNIVLIDPDKAIVTGNLDLTGLIPENIPRNADYCLNGIAYNKKTDTFYITGKQWSVMYEIKLDLDF
jgi:glutaminyl-peptide cyclotransferase